MGQKHERLREEFFLLLIKEFPQSRIFKRDVGLYYTANNTPIRIGMVGQSDSYAMINIKELLIHVEIEYKIGKDKQSKEQKDWQKVVESLNGIYLLIHNIDFTPEMAIKRLKEVLGCSNISPAKSELIRQK